MTDNKKIYASKVIILLDFLYFILLLCNVVASKIIPSLLALLLFLLASPIFFRKYKAKHYVIIKKLNIIVILPVLIFLIFSLVHPLMTGSTAKIEGTIPVEEQGYIDTILSQITIESSKEDVILLLGKPDRDLISKVNWWVSIDGRDSRVGVYFSTSTGNANEIVLDGGVGKFYYRKTLEPLSP